MINKEQGCGSDGSKERKGRRTGAGGVAERTRGGFYTQHVLWTDGVELYITPFLYSATEGENELACGTQCLANFHSLT